MMTITQSQKKDIRLLGKFIEVYCCGKHASSPKSSFKLPQAANTLNLCAGCSGFMEYAINKRLKCPLEKSKPSCKNCHIHCYGKEERKKVKEIMAYSGRKLLMRGRLDYIWHYLF